VTLFNQTTTPGRSRGVGCLNFTKVPLDAFKSYDAIILLNWAALHLVRQLRSAARQETPIILWSQHLYDQPAVQELRDQAAQDAWDWFVLCTNWQARGYKEVFGIKPERIKIIGNGMSPAFENLYPELDTIALQKPWPPVLCYTSTPFRGLDVLLMAFPHIRASIPGTTLKVYSSMRVYNIDPGQDPYVPLYELCRATEGVEYVGSLPQPQLAQELKAATCLAYPNTFAENFSIAVLEAMAAGLIVVTSDLGGLRESTFGFGHLLVPTSDKRRHSEVFARFAVGVLEEFRSHSAEYSQRLAKQVAFINQTATRTVRAREWETWLSSKVPRQHPLAQR
jgi:glycosyltransferase involved in cell wall biosynthesis